MTAALTALACPSPSPLPEGFRVTDRRVDGWSGRFVILALEFVDPLRGGQWSELDTRTFEQRAPVRDAEVRSALTAQLERAARDFIGSHPRYPEQLRALPWRADHERLSDLHLISGPIRPQTGVPESPGGRAMDLGAVPGGTTRWSRITRALQA